MFEPNKGSNNTRGLFRSGTKGHTTSEVGYSGTMGKSTSDVCYGVVQRVKQHLRFVT